ncbi:hypothetical protein TVAG_444610 [Trichomonas vaginalis G3]|uniref:Uncharacterized protein n=1 Tax=Trichomonas vaginalis (strain ATCC PRA-98 / G3) TaxID=412133 RepID=A2E2K2_TRIV3|nr:hypothetical protein TVAG_444610 [Trichomonas vaginalis G3]|eukprot:XP_001325400.1 hypothetical protein [Trichomonas vaginalis G3]
MTMLFSRKFSYNKALQSAAGHILPIYSLQRPAVPCFVAKFGYHFPIRPNLATKTKDNSDFEQQNKCLFQSPLSFAVYKKAGKLCLFTQLLRQSFPAI